MRQKLTTLAIDRLPHPDSGSVKYWDTVLPGFGIRVSKRSKSFFIMFGKERRLKTLGKHPDMSLKLARDAAKRLQVTDTPARQLGRLSAAREAYLEECEAKNRPATVRQYRHFLERSDREYLTDVVKTDIDISSPHAVTIWKVFFNWCIRNELVDKNPFAFLRANWKQRTRLLTDAEISSIWNYDFPPYSTILKLLILTGQRVNQFGKFEQSWVDGENVKFPAAIMKGGKEHTIPLTPLLAEYIPQHIPFNGWGRAKERIDKHVVIPHWTTHDLRRYFASTHAALGTPVHVVEALLSHTSGTISGVTAIYIRHNFLAEAREAQLRYEDHITKTVRD